MKSKSIYLNIFILLSILTFDIGFSQDFKDLDLSPMDRVAYPLSHNNSDKWVRVTYSRPQLKGRTVESLTPYGEVWRTGANEATEITFYKNASIEGKPVKSGSYTFFTIPGEKEWTIILNSDLNIWGAYDYNKNHDVLRIKVPVKNAEKFIEAFTMAFDDHSNLHLAWGNFRVSIPISFTD